MPGALDQTKNNTDIFEQVESEVRGYCRSFPTVFTRAEGATLTDEEGVEYTDFLAGAGTLNYGHNHPVLKKAVLDYVAGDGLIHGLDMYSTAKRAFLEAFKRHILEPREMNHKLQFTGPTGTNAVEAAMKIARNYTGRTNIVAFTNGFHGMTLGSVAATGNSYYRDAAGVDLDRTTFMPYDGYLGEHVDTLVYFERMLTDTSSGLDKPAAVLVETIQGEGGVNEASYEWLRGLERICREHELVFIVDDIQMGCGRTGTFFSFEEAGIDPDIITVSKSLSGFGLPMSLVLMKPNLDQWKPGQHNGTFRGHNLAFVTAKTAIEEFWSDTRFSKEIREKSWILGERLHKIRENHPGIIGVRGRGLIFGVECSPPELAGAICREAFERQLILETCGANDQVVKFLPPLTTDTQTLERGLDIFEDALQAALDEFPELTANLIGTRT
jgi:diaminobutyrate-2-oxoglutarate transaminase